MTKNFTCGLSLILMCFIAMNTNCQAQEVTIKDRLGIGGGIGVQYVLLDQFNSYQVGSYHEQTGLNWQTMHFSFVKYAQILFRPTNSKRFFISLSTEHSRFASAFEVSSNGGGRLYYLMSTVEDNFRLSTYFSSFSAGYRFLRLDEMSIYGSLGVGYCEAKLFHSSEVTHSNSSVFWYKSKTHQANNIGYNFRLGYENYMLKRLSMWIALEARLAKVRITDWYNGATETPQNGHLWKGDHSMQLDLSGFQLKAGVNLFVF